jgi:uncharacterized delta-60 repeat protein
VEFSVDPAVQGNFIVARKTIKAARALIRSVQHAVAVASVFSMCALGAPVAIAGAGGVLPGFGTGGTYVVTQQTANDAQLLMTEVAVQANGAVILVGQNSVEAVVMRLLSNGTPDVTYGTNGIVRIAPASRIGGAMLQTDGKLVLAIEKAFNVAGGELVRLTTAGQIDSTFGVSGRAATFMRPQAIALAADGKILVGGQTVLSRFLANGSIDTTFAGGTIQMPADVWPTSIAVNADLSVIAVGEFLFPSGPVRRQRVTRILPAGVVDSQFGTAGIVDAALPGNYGAVDTQKVVLDASGRILIAGDAVVTCGSGTGNCKTVVVNRLLADGSADATFGTAGVASLGTDKYLISPDIALQPDGAILISANGEYGPSGASPPSVEIVFARLLSTGVLDTNFGTAGVSLRDLSTSSGCELLMKPAEIGIRPDGVAFALGHWSVGPSCVGGAAVSSFLLRDADNDSQPEAWDLTPDALVFANATNALSNIATFSFAQTVAGLESAVAVPVNATGGEFALNGSTLFRSAGWVRNGDQVQLRQQSSATAAASVTMQFTAGGVQPSNNQQAALGTRTTSSFTTVTRAGPPGTLAVASATAAVAENAGPVLVSVTRSGGSAGALSVMYSTAAGTAQPVLDFTATSGTLVWADGDAAAKTITIPIVNDSVPEVVETFTLTISSPGGGATLGAAVQAITINDEDVAGQLAFGTTTAAITESGGSALLSVARTGGTAGAVTIAYSSASGSAVAGSDFTTSSGVLSWADGDAATKTFTVPITNDSVNEPVESFTVVLSAPTGGATLGSGTATITINDDDAAQAPPSSGQGGSGGGGGMVDSSVVAGLLAMLLMRLRMSRNRLRKGLSGGSQTS